MFNILKKCAFALIIVFLFTPKVEALELEEISLDQPSSLRLALLEESAEQNKDLELKLDNSEKQNMLEETDAKQRNIFQSYAQELKIYDDKRPFLENALHFEDKGVFEDITFFGGYRGDLGFDFTGDSYSTTFRNNISEVGVYGKFKEIPLDYFFSVNPRSIAGQSYINSLLVDLFFTYKGIPHHSISVGHMRAPTGVEGSMSAYSTPFLSRSQIGRTFGNVRALGVKVKGDYSLIDYTLGGFSSDRYLHSFFPGAEFIGLVNLKPLGKTDGKYGKLTLSGGLQAGHRYNNYTVGTLGAAYQYKKFKADFEYSIADGYNGYNSVKQASTNRAEGFYTSVYYNLTDKIQLLARYDAFNPDKSKSSSHLQKEYTAGINYLIRGDALKIMINYIYYEGFKDTNGSRLYVGTQIML